MVFRKDLPEAGGSKNFLKLKDKESVEGIFFGEIHEFSQVWDGGKSFVVPEGTPKASFRFRVNFIMKEGSVYSAKIFENGAIVYRQLGELHEEYDLPSTVVKITRNGTGTDTTYSILPLLKKTVTPELKEHLKTVELQELETKKDQSTNGPSDDIPF
jgi:hypothetical protein